MRGSGVYIYIDSLIEGSIVGKADIVSTIDHRSPTIDQTDIDRRQR